MKIMHTFNMIIRQKGKYVYYQEDLKKAITSSSILLTFSTNFPLPEPFEMFSRIRCSSNETCKFHKVGKVGRRS